MVCVGRGVDKSILYNFLWAPQLCYQGWAAVQDKPSIRGAKPQTAEKRSVAIARNEGGR